jgi:tetratricopeptide (TPR) repeat protein
VRGRYSRLALLALVTLGVTHARAQHSPASPYAINTGERALSSPGNAETETGAAIRAGAFPTARYCGHCHQQAYAEWREALHSNSFREPFYRTSVNILLRTRGTEPARHCDSCHNPIGVVSGALAKGANISRTFDEDGVTCTTCHSITALQPTYGNGGYVMAVPAVMVDANGKRIPGVVSDAEIMSHPERHARAVMQDIYHSAKFCAACHKANLPYSLNGYKWLRAFTTYDEWQNSKFSQQNPLTFYQASFRSCQDCHMMRERAQPGEYGAKRGTFASHRWLAGNTGTPFYYGFQAQLDKSIEFLKSGMYLNVDLFALKTETPARVVAPLGASAFFLNSGQTVQVWVVIQNKNIGHSFVPEVRDLYQAWVEFQVTDANGCEIYHSGYLNPDGSLDARAHTFNNRPVDSAGEFVDNHKVWTIHSLAYDNTIQSGRSTLVRYEFHIPAGAKGPLRMKVRVNYRHFRKSYIDNVLGPRHPAYPVVEIAAQTRVIDLGNNPVLVLPREASDNPDWMRWNNLGIAFLDQLQYADALNAFEHVLQLRPDYVDGYTNIGVTYIEWEKYSEARPALEKALALQAGNARALYYLSIVERREDHDAAELADLKQVIAQYPEARDPRRELGIYYYQHHQYAEAREQFEALQEIDPDDLAAHYNLAVIYRRLGMKDKAAEQAALFATKQIDPGAPTYSLDYLRHHPEISIESVPWHIHREADQRTDNP